MIKKIIKRIVPIALCGVMLAGGLLVYNGYGKQNLRVGLERYYMGVSQLNIANSNVNLSYNGGNIFLSGNDITLQPVSGNYTVDKYYKSYDEVKNSGTAVFDENGWGIIETDKNTVVTTVETETSTKAYDFIDEDATEVTTEMYEIKNNKEVVTSSNLNTFKTTAIKVTYSNGEFILNTSGSVTISADSPIDLGEMAYRGDIEVTSTGSSLNTINILSVDEYLYGVVPAEVYSSWPAEALKAQAVAARTYTEYHFGKHSGFDLCDNTHCQQYSGYSIEEQSTNQAVDATSGVMAYYNGKPINSVYFDCDGGYTLSAEEVWGSDIHYLQSTPDPYEIDAREWEKTFTLDEVTSLANVNGYNIGNVLSVQVTKMRENIVVEEVTLTGTNGKAVLKNGEIKEFFQKDGERIWTRAFTISGSIAPSNNVYVTGVSGTSEKMDINVVSAIDSNGEVTVLQDINCVLCGKDGDIMLGNSGTLTEAKDSIVIKGSGWGHGVGMSQRGAYGMAVKGYNYKEILKHYYKDIEVH